MMKKKRETGSVAQNAGRRDESRHVSSADELGEFWTVSARRALDGGDLVAAARLLETHDAAHATDLETLRLFVRVMRMRGRRPDACAALERAIARHPEQLEIRVERARLAREMGQREQASEWFRSAWNNTNWHANWVSEWLDLLIQLKQLDLAQQVAQMNAGRAQNDESDAWFWLGYVLQLNQQSDQALVAYLRCASIAPNRSMLRNNLGVLYLEKNDFDGAKMQLNLALRTEPENASVWTNLIVLELKAGDPFAARVAAERAIALDPRSARAWQGYSNALKELQEWDDASQAIARARALEPDDESYRWSQAMLQLLRGQYELGWPAHETRWTGSPELRAKMPQWRAPRWYGQEVAGKTILVWSEQGFGDVLQFVRFLPEFTRRVRAQGGDVKYCAFPQILSLMQRSLAGQVSEIAPSLLPDIPVHDYQIPLASLPLVMNVMLEDLRDYAAPYLTVDPEPVEQWRSRCAGGTLKVGIVWSGSRSHQRNPYRSVPAADLARALAGIEGATFYNLQKEATPGELDAIREAGLTLVDYSSEWQTFDDTAAFMSQLDLVITVCTSMAHLAGALNVPTWLMLDVNPHWIWMADRSDSPWYASMRLYRQPAFGQWQPVLDEISRALQAHTRTSQQEAVLAG